jgi:hypothetical protein
MNQRLEGRFGCTHRPVIDQVDQFGSLCIGAAFFVSRLSSLCLVSRLDAAGFGYRAFDIRIKQIA